MKIILWIAVTVAAVTLSACFAFLPQGNGHLSIGVELPPQAKGPGDYPVLIFVANADMEDSIKELLRLTEVAKDVANRGLVKFGGDPFLRTSISTSASSGSLEIPGVPAGRSYFVKMIVFAEEADISSIDNLAEQDVHLENRLFTFEVYTKPFASWGTSQIPVSVEAGETAQVNMSLVAEIQ
jgi:hypothetical protein